MKKKLSKYNSGGASPAGKIKSKTVIKSDDGNYRTVEKSTASPSGYSESSKTRRTVKGVVAGAAKPNRNPMMGPPPTTAPLMVPPSKKPPMAKKGGSVKKKK